MRFKPRISFKGTLPFFAGSIFVLGTGVFFMIAAVPTGRLYAGFVTAFGAVFLATILVKTLAPGCFYEIQPDTLLIKMGLIKKKIPRTQIKKVSLVCEQETEYALKDYQAKVYEQTGTRDMVGSFKAQFAMGDFIRYCTVPVVFNETKVGGKFTPSDPSTVLRYGADTTGTFVLLELENGKKHILSPVDTENFVKQLG